LTGKTKVKSTRGLGSSGGTGSTCGSRNRRGQKVYWLGDVLKKVKG